MPAASNRRRNCCHENMPVHTDWPLRLFTLTGASHSGSSLLAYHLGRLEGVGNIGEAGALTHCKADLLDTPIDFDQPLGNTTPVCVECGQTCPVLSKAFRRSLQQSPVNWSYKIARQLNTHVLVTVDDGFGNLQAKSMEIEPERLIVFKSPLQSWYSAHCEKLTDRSVARSDNAIENWAREWVDSYSTFLREANTSHSTHYVFIDALYEQSMALFPRLKAQLGLQKNRIVHKHQHYLANNFSHLEFSQKRVVDNRMTPLKPTTLPAADIRYINANASIQDVFNELKARVSYDFAVLKAVS